MGKRVEEPTNGELAEIPERTLLERVEDCRHRLSYCASDLDGASTAMDWAVALLGETAQRLREADEFRASLGPMFDLLTGSPEPVEQPEDYVRENIERERNLRAERDRLRGALSVACDEIEHRHQRHPDEVTSGARKVLGSCRQALNPQPVSPQTHDEGGNE